MPANERYLDAQIRHQIGVRRLASHEASEVLKLLEAADRDLVGQLRRRLAMLKGSTNTTTKRFRELIKDFRVARRETILELRRRTRPDLIELAKTEVDFEQRMIRSALAPVQVDFAAVSIRQLHAAVTSKPFNGRQLNSWFESLATSDRGRLEQAIRLGVAQGESIPQIVRRVAGTRAERFRDGALSVTRREAEAVVRTAVNHVSNASREVFWQENDDLIGTLQWSATLDGRTTRICAARDGKNTPAKPGGTAPPPLLHPPGARPPAHVNCRSIMVAALDGLGVLGERPFVRDVRRPAQREVDLRKIAREQGKSIRQVRQEWTAANVGRVPAQVKYGTWLKRQPAKFQDEVLGSTRAKLFRKGKVKVDQFVDRRGNELTLDELRKTRPEAFELAGLPAG
jgi:SPP1 gp7 family putative phage head morphogenesis protein